MTKIAPQAVVELGAQLGRGVEIAPGCYVGPKVRIGEATRLMPNVVVLGNTTIGARNVLYPGCVVGAAPQDLKYAGADTQLIIGDDNIFRELVTVHVGTELGGGVTRIGSHNQFQVGTHIAHDSCVGNHCVFSNSVQIAGHVVIEDCVNISGLVGVQQFVTIGRNAFITGAARCTTDVPPYLIYGGFDGSVISVNAEGLRRWKFSEEQIDGIWRLYKAVFSKRAERGAATTLAERLAAVESNGPLDEHTAYLLNFVKRSLMDGNFGRHLERKRRDGSAPTPEFYARKQ